MSGNRFQIQLFFSADGAVHWRLLSGNNRAVGRGAISYPSETDCRRELVSLQSEIERMDRRIRRTDDHRWSWELELDGVPVARCGQPFDRLIRCEQGLAGFRAGFARAPIAVTVVESGVRSWRVASVTARVPDIQDLHDRSRRPLARPGGSHDRRW